VVGREGGGGCQEALFMVMVLSGATSLGGCLGLPCLGGGSGALWDVVYGGGGSLGGQMDAWGPLRMWRGCSRGGGGRVRSGVGVGGGGGERGGLFSMRKVVFVSPFCCDGLRRISSWTSAFLGDSRRVTEQSTSSGRAYNLVAVLRGEKFLGGA